MLSMLVRNKVVRRQEGNKLDSRSLVAGPLYLSNYYDSGGLQLDYEAV